MSAPVSASPLALLAAELSALAGPGRRPAVRLASATGYSVRGVWGVLGGTDRPSELLLDLLADELGADPEARARWQRLRVASLPPPASPPPPEGDVREHRLGAPLRCHAGAARRARSARVYLARKLREARRAEAGVCPRCRDVAGPSGYCERHRRAPAPRAGRPPGRPRGERGDRWAQRRGAGESAADIAGADGVSYATVASALRVRGVL